jgi:hypothetical protein
LGSSLLDSDDTLELKFEMDSHTALVEAANETTKACGYQERRGRDLFCLGARGISDHPVGSGRDLTGKTSRRACETICTLPDSRLLCSAFMHVGVVMQGHGPPQPRVGPRVCDVGNDKEIEQEEKCVPGENLCWHRTLDLGVATTRPVEPPLALLEAFDFLSVVWDSKFKAGRLIRSLGTAPPASLMQPCATRDEFKSRLSDFSDILKMFQIDDSLLSNPQAIPKDQTGNRIKEVAKQKLPANEAVRVDAAVGRLRWINEIRTGMQHGAVAKKAQQGAAAIGLAWPTTDWAAAWNHVRGVAVEALRELRQAIDIP